MSIEDIMTRVADYDTKFVTVTGGEPLAQKECHQLLKTLCDSGYSVSLETGGGIDIAHVDERVSVIMDIKTPDSNEETNMRWSNLDHIQAKDEIKFVICGRSDYEWAKTKITELELENKCQIIFSPSFSDLAPMDLAAWVLADQLSVRVQVQLHKILWGEKAGV